MEDNFNRFDFETDKTNEIKAHPDTAQTPMHEKISEGFKKPIEIKERKEKRQRKKYPVGLIALMLVLCITVSTVSGASGAYLMFRSFGFTKNTTTAGTPENNETEEELHYEPTGNSQDTSEEEISEDNTFMPEVSADEKEGISVTETVSETFAPVEEHTTLPALSKGDIYSVAVNSIFAISSTYNQKYNTLFGSYTRPATSTGTGFAVTNNGYIITNNHVVENGIEITITDYQGKTYPAKLIGTEPKNDVAILKIEAATIPVPFGNSSELKVGDDIMVIGNALGQLSYTFTDGIVSHLSRDIKVENGTVIRMFQTNAAINNGNSGGPVYDMNGKVVGIASAKYASETVEGLGFCIPVDDIKSMVADIILFGYVTGKPSLDLSLQTVTNSMSARYSIPVGCYVVALENNGAAANAGIKTGDVITKIDGDKITDTTSLEKIIADKKAGEIIQLSFYREGTQTSVNLTLSEKKPSNPRTEYSNVVDL